MLGYTHLHQNKNFDTPEDRARRFKYNDPLILNYRLLIDFDSPIGLFAPEVVNNQINYNSALGFLKRIGENARYAMLKKFIELFKVFVKEYEFMNTSVEGLDIIQNKKPWDSFNEDEDRLTFNIRESSDMFFQSLLTLYSAIWFDNIRKVEVLPLNLRKFDLSVLVFSAGYYNLWLYDDLDGTKANEIERLIFPTLSKLQDYNYINKGAERYNHMIYRLSSCSINNEESGKTFSANVSNEQSTTFVNNSLVINFKFASYSGRFNNIVGDIDTVALLALNAAFDKALVYSKETNAFLTDMFKEVESPIDKLKKSWSRNSLKAQGTDLLNSSTSFLEGKAGNQLNKFFGENTPVGDLLRMGNSSFVKQMVQNTFEKGINFLEQNYINDPITKINNILLTNFNNNLFDIYRNFSNLKVPENPKLFGNEKFSTKVNNELFRLTTPPKINNSVKFEQSNIYKRNSF